DDRIPLAPLQEFPEGPQHFELLPRLLDARAFLRDDEGYGIHAEAVHAELDPEAHDLQDFRLDGRVRSVEVGLVLVEAVEVVPAGLLVAAPGGLLDAWKDHALVGVWGLLLRPDVPVAVGGGRIAA